MLSSAQPCPSPDCLVSRRMKECCVQLHATIQKWKQLSQKGFDIATKLVNTSQYKKHTYNTGGIPDAHGSFFLEAKIIEEREKLFIDLTDVQHQLENIVEKMGTLNGNVRAAIELIISSQDSCQAVFFTLSPTAFGLHFENVYKAYCEELSLRQTILGDILKCSDRDTLTTYMSCWLYEPYIRADSKESLEALLIDSGLR